MKLSDALSRRQDTPPPKSPPAGAENGFGCLSAVLSLPMSVLLLLVRGWACWLLYGWFGQPLGGPALSYAHVTGLFVAFDLLKGTTPRTPPELNVVFYTLAHLTGSLISAAAGWTIYRAVIVGW